MLWVNGEEALMHEVALSEANIEGLIVQRVPEISVAKGVK